MSSTRRIAILGSTGSIGTQTLDVIAQHPDKFEVEVLTAHSNLTLLVSQAKQFKPNAVVIADTALYQPLKDALAHEPIKVYAGAQALDQVVAMPSVDLVVSALVGFAGVMPTIAAIKAGKPVALANKETLVVAGDLISRLAIEHKVPVIPVDSEHSAIFQCLAGEPSPIEQIYLTASGGPFLRHSQEQLATVTKAQALKHPQWIMGAKVTIDSSTLMNKGFEVIEARWLFDLHPTQIQVLVHPQSIVHSMVQFADGSIKAQLGMPDMRIPIAYALSYPERLPLSSGRFDFATQGNFTFEAPDTSRFPCLALAYQAMRLGGNAACAVNAANEIAVAAFLAEQISYLQIPAIIENALASYTHIAHPGLADYVHTDHQVRLHCQQVVAQQGRTTPLS